MTQHLCTWWGTLLAGVVTVLGILLAAAVALGASVLLWRYVLRPRGAACRIETTAGKLFDAVSSKALERATKGIFVVWALFICWGVGKAVVKKLCGGG